MSKSVTDYLADLRLITDIIQSDEIKHDSSAMRVHVAQLEQLATEFAMYLMKEGK